jgi:hypothetical protein
MPNQNDYPKLKKIWYKKLKDSGFNDIETPSGDLKGGSLNWRFNSAFAVRYSHASRQEYYYLANQFLESHNFESELHRTIWTYHTEGTSTRDIAKILKDAGIGKFYKRLKNKSNVTRPLSAQAIWLVIDKYSKIFKKLNGFK